jgi:TolA-binding protein
LSGPAPQAAPGATREQRAFYSVPYVYRASFSRGGPDESGAGQTSGAVAPAAPVTGMPAAGSSNATAVRPANATGNGTVQAVQYVDAQGQPVEAPLDPVQAIAAVRRDMHVGDMKAAYEKAEKLLNHPYLNREQREEVLHLNAELLFAVNKDNLAAQYDKISAATQQAINYNQQSQRNAGALLRLGFLNLKVNNPNYAEAYFNMLRRQFPGDESIPLTYYYWGEYHYGRNEMQRAADQFQYVVQHFSESKYSREASLGLARSYVQLGYVPQAYDVMDYIEKRWPRFYLDYPPVLEMMGDIGFRMDNLDYALSNYWTYYNIVPDSPNADVILTRIGDVYTRRRQPAAAREIYNESVRRFPDKDGGLVAMMRLAEEGINDRPTIENMFSVFERPFSLRPSEVYANIIEKHPQSPLVPLARLKLAKWQLWNKRFEEALAQCAAIVTDTPDSELAPKARELALKAFGILAAEAIAQNRSALVQDVWKKYPIVSSQEEALSPESRVALGASLWGQGQADKALQVVDPFFLGSKIPEYSEMALNIALGINLEHDRWQAIKDLSGRVASWQLTDASRRELDYALALANENQGQAEEAAALWNRLRDHGGLNDSQQAYAAYFLARDAETRRDLEAAYNLGRDALNRFLSLEKNNPKDADTDKIVTMLSSLMKITESAGRLQEAQQYAQQYMGYLPANSPERPALMLRIAELYKKQGDTAAWRKGLTELAQNYPDSMYGQFAASALRGDKLTQDAAQFSPTGQL